jgi:hypothetical protein
MKTQYKKYIIAAIAVLTIRALNFAAVKADTRTGELIYNNHAYIYAIPGAPNPAADRTVQDAEIMYADKAYGPAIYSYPTNAAYQQIAFNIEYVNLAYGPAIYSYPYNNNQRYRLNLATNLEDPWKISDSAIMSSTEGK